MSENLKFNQVNQQESSGYIQGLSRKDNMPTVLVERSSGKIQTGRLDQSTRNVHFSDVNPETGVEETMMHPRVPLEKLSDEHQELLAARLAGAALRSVGQEVDPFGGKPNSGITSSGGRFNNGVIPIGNHGP